METILLVIAAGIIGLVSFIAGIAYTRRSLRRDPAGFAENVARAKDLTAEVRARWQRMADQFKQPEG